MSFDPTFVNSLKELLEHLGSSGLGQMMLPFGQHQLHVSVKEFLTHAEQQELFGEGFRILSASVGINGRRGSQYIDIECVSRLSSHSCTGFHRIHVQPEKRQSSLKQEKGFGIRSSGQWMRCPQSLRSVWLR